MLYASFDPAELRAEQTSARGLKDLKSYLELAARGVAPTDDSTSRVPVIDRHRDEIAAVLRERGLVVKTDVGLSDSVSISRSHPRRTPPSHLSPSCSTEKAGERAERWRIAMAFPSMSSGS